MKARSAPKRKNKNLVLAQRAIVKSSDTIDPTIQGRNVARVADHHVRVQFLQIAPCASASIGADYLLMSLVA